jgi:hypothetical protein
MKNKTSNGNMERAGLEIGEKQAGNRKYPALGG